MSIELLHTSSGAGSNQSVVDVRWLARFERAGLIALALAAARSVLGLAGWASGIPLLTVGPGLGAIRPTQPWTFVLLAACAIGLRSMPPDPVGGPP